MSLVGMIVVLSVLLLIILAATIIGSYFGKKFLQSKCVEGPAFWCADRLNWNLCVDDTEKYDDYCCKDNQTWMSRTGTQNVDPATNGFDDNCKGS